MRYYGLHATCKAKQVKGVLTALMVARGRLIKGTYRIVAQKTYRERVLASTGRDPLRCAHCGREMMLWHGLGHMTLDTYRKQFLFTFHMAFKAKSNSAEIPRSSKESCSRNMVLRR